MFEDIIEKIIKDVVASNVVLKLSNLGNDGFKQVNQQPFARFNSSLGFGNDSLDSSINLFQDSLDSRGGSSNLSINSCFDLVQEINDVILHFARFNLGFDLVGKISKVFTDGGDQVFNGMLKGRLKDIIEKIVKDIVSSEVVLELTNFGDDGFK